jgi:hypothetical protein
MSPGTDEHHSEQLAFVELSLAAAILAKIPQDRILNFLPVSKVLHWVDSTRGR